MHLSNLLLTLALLAINMASPVVTPSVTDDPSKASLIKSQITTKSKKYIIFFGANYCAHTIEATPAWTKVAESLRETATAKGVEIIRFECAQKTFCQELFGIDDIPTIRYYSKGIDSYEKIQVVPEIDALSKAISKYLA